MRLFTLRIKHKASGEWLRTIPPQQNGNAGFPAEEVGPAVEMFYVAAMNVKAENRVAVEVNLCRTDAKRMASYDFNTSDFEVVAKLVARGPIL